MCALYSNISRRRNGRPSETLAPAVSVDHKPWSLSCQCARQKHRQELPSLEGHANVVSRLLWNRYNRGAQDAEAALNEDEGLKKKLWEEAAEGAGVSLYPPRQVVIYSDEKLKDRFRLEILRQVKYTGTNAVIPSSLADTSCSRLGLNKMLQSLNSALRTRYDLDRPGLSATLQNFISRGFDFGLAYGYLRFHWFDDFIQLEKKMEEWEAADRARREAAVDGEYIRDRSLPPRRVWDLYSDRVLPWWILRKWNPRSHTWDAMESVDAVSHSWVHPKDCKSVWTPINSRKWPVPIPSDISLNRVRVELLNIGRHVVWLDVLCLWQEGVSTDNEQRLEQWKLDVPTIGNIYQPSESLKPPTVITYFNGLGRVFRIGKLDDQRHWLNRAWTLQEFNSRGIIGGVLPGSFPPRVDNKGRIITNDPNVVCFYQRLEVASNNNCMRSNVILSVLSAMGPRHAAHVVDKVGGITHILALERITTYVRSEAHSAAESAWNLLVPVMGNNNRADLFFFYPVRGSGPHAWCPSWDQVTNSLPPAPPFAVDGSVKYDGNHKVFRCIGWLISECTVEGLAKPHPNHRCRAGTLRVGRDGVDHSFAVSAHHQEPIPDGSYALIGERSSSGHGIVVWAVGTLTSHGVFEKLSVLRTEEKGDTEKIFELKLIAWASDRRDIQLM